MNLNFFISPLSVNPNAVRKDPSRLRQTSMDFRLYTFFLFKLFTYPLDFVSDLKNPVNHFVGVDVPLLFCFSGIISNLGEPSPKLLLFWRLASLLRLLTSMRSRENRGSSIHYAYFDLEKETKIYLKINWHSIFK